MIEKLIAFLLNARIGTMVERKDNVISVNLSIPVLREEGDAFIDKLTAGIEKEGAINFSVRLIEQDNKFYNKMEIKVN